MARVPQTNRPPHRRRKRNAKLTRWPPPPIIAPLAPEPFELTRPQPPRANNLQILDRHHPRQLPPPRLAKVVIMLLIMLRMMKPTVAACENSDLRADSTCISSYYDMPRPPPGRVPGDGPARFGPRQRSPGRDVARRRSRSNCQTPSRHDYSGKTSPSPVGTNVVSDRSSTQTPRDRNGDLRRERWGRASETSNECACDTSCNWLDNARRADGIAWHRVRPPHR